MGDEHIATRTLTPYEQMEAERARRGTQSRARLSDYQREQRKLADIVARQRAYRVLLDRHREEYNALIRAERSALVGLVDRAWEAGDMRPLSELLDEGKANGHAVTGTD